MLLSFLTHKGNTIGQLIYDEQFKEVVFAPIGTIQMNAEFMHEVVKLMETTKAKIDNKIIDPNNPIRIIENKADQN